MKFPAEGQPQEHILKNLQSRKSDDVPWAEGRVFAYIYDAGDEAKQLLSTIKSLKERKAELIKLQKETGDNLDLTKAFPELAP